jgi:PknH-like extracellular domain
MGRGLFAGLGFATRRSRGHIMRQAATKASQDIGPVRVAVKSVARVGALLSSVLIVLLAETGCTDVIDGAVLTPRPLTGQTIQQVLLAGTDLSNIFDQSFEGENGFSFGGSAIMHRGSVDSGPHECAGVARMLLQGAYSGSNVQEVGTGLWWDSRPYAKGPAVLLAEEGVVALPTMTAAEAVFAKFTEQWHHCVGATVTFTGSFHDDISDVRVIDSVLVATVRQRSDDTTIREARAIGVRMNCLVEVAVSFYQDVPPEVSGGHGKSAIDVARLMMDKVSGLS